MGHRKQASARPAGCEASSQALGPQPCFCQDRFFLENRGRALPVFRNNTHTCWLWLLRCRGHAGPICGLSACPGPCSPAPFSATGTSAHMKTTNQRQTPGPSICRGRCRELQPGPQQCSCNNAALSWRGPSWSRVLGSWDFIPELQVQVHVGAIPWEELTQPFFSPGEDQRGHPSCPLVPATQGRAPGWAAFCSVGCSPLRPSQLLVLIS